MIINNIKIIIIIIYFFCINISQSKDIVIEKIWFKDTDKNILNQINLHRITDKNIIILFSNSKIYAIKKGYVIWKKNEEILKNNYIKNNNKILLFINNKKILTAINLNNGNVIWKKNINKKLISISNVTNNNAYLYIDGNKLVKIDINNGKNLWKFQINLDNISLNTNNFPIISKKYIYNFFKNGILCKINKSNGKLILSKNTSSKQKYTDIYKLLYTISSSSIHNNIIYACNNRKELIALNVNNGNIVWKNKYKKKIKEYIYKGNVILKDNKSFTNINKSNGKKIWKKIFSNKIINHIFIKDKNIIIYVDNKNYLYCLNIINGKILNKYKINEKSIIDIINKRNNIYIITKDGSVIKYRIL